MLYKINKAAAEFYSWWLRSGHAESARAYIGKRRISEDLQLKFCIGASPKYGDTLYRHLLKKFKRADLIGSGLFIVKEDGSIADKFFNRLMFPIRDADGRYVGFGARKMSGEGPKYINSPQTDIFSKKEILYAFDKAKGTSTDGLIVCEGYMDVIAMHQAGITNAVASLGTALTHEHAALIKRNFQKAVLLYDSDEAGRLAAERACLLCRESAISASVVTLEGAKDPDEYIRKFGAASFNEALHHGTDTGLFLAKRAAEKFWEHKDIKKLSDFLISTYDDPDEIIRMVESL